MGVKVHYSEKSGKFEVACSFAENSLAQGLPDRRWVKARRVWEAPALRRNVEYIHTNFRKEQMTEEAIAFLSTYSFERKVITETFPAWYKFKTEPMAHQLRCINKAWGKDFFAILMEQGTGKSKAVIDLTAAYRMAGKIEALLVMCPASARLVWGNDNEELAIHCPIPYDVHILTAGGAEKAKTWMLKKHDFKVLVVGIEALSQGNGWEVARLFASTRKTLGLIDESSRIKNAQATCSVRAKEIGQECVIRIIMTGTPVTQGLEDIYSQFEYLDPDILGFQSFYSFRNYFCVMGGFEERQIVGYSNTKELLELIDPYSIRVTKDEAMPYLPKKVYQRRYVEMTPEQAKIYKDLKKNMKAEIGDKTISAKTILEKMLRLQEVVGGFYATQNGFGDSGKPIYDHYTVPGKNPKFDELEQALEDIWPTSGHKCIIFTWSRHELHAISKRLRDKGYKVVEFHGGIDADGKAESKKAFQSGDAEIFLATQKTAQMALTLTICKYAIYVTNNFSLEQRLQSEDRCHRRGSEIHENITYIDIIMNKTVDMLIEESILNKKSVADMVSDALKSGDLGRFIEENL